METLYYNILTRNFQDIKKKILVSIDSKTTGLLFSLVLRKNRDKIQGPQYIHATFLI